MTFAIRFGFGVAVAVLWFASACSSTDDLVGLNQREIRAAGGEANTGGSAGMAGVSSAGESGAAGAVDRTYPNLFADLLGKSESEISAKLDGAFQQLFYGDPKTESIYVEVGTDRAYVWDPRADEVRADGFSAALLIAVQLDRRKEFDKLWRWADAHIVPRTGPLRGYVRLHCLLDGSSCEPAVTAEPHFNATTALWLADGRWGSGGDIHYANEAKRLMEATFRAGASEQTQLGELIGFYDSTRGLPRLTPYASARESTTSAAMLAAYFDLWAEKADDERAQLMADSARAFWEKMSDESSGLMPELLSLDGVPKAGDDTFSTACYPVPLAMGIDSVWFGSSSWQVAEANRLLTFFRGPLTADNLAISYTLEGAPGAPLSDKLSLFAPLSAISVAATVDFRREFVQAVWDAELNTGTSRKFGNVHYMLSALLLSGRFRVY